MGKWGQMSTRSPVADLLQRIDWPLELTWVDRVGYHRYGGGRLAKIELFRSDTDRYVGLRVTVLDGAGGLVDEHRFSFADYLGGRVYLDDHAVGWCGWPSKTEMMPEDLPARLARAVTDYVDLFR